MKRALDVKFDKGVIGPNEARNRTKQKSQTGRGMVEIGSIINHKKRQIDQIIRRCHFASLSSANINHNSSKQTLERLPGMKSLVMPHWPRQKYDRRDRSQRKSRSRFCIQDISISYTPPAMCAQSIVIRFDTGPPTPGFRSGNSVIFSFSSSPPIFRFNMCVFNPLLKLPIQIDALMMVRRINNMVRTAKLVRFLRTGR